MTKNIDFQKLPTEKQLSILREVYDYDEARIVHEYGKDQITASIIIQATYSKDHWISQTFKKSDFPFDDQLASVMITPWWRLCQIYDSDPYVEKQDYKTADDIINLRNIIYESQIKCYLIIVLDKFLNQKETKNELQISLEAVQNST